MRAHITACREAVLLLSAAMAGAASAQESPAPAAANADLARVVVTGSRLVDRGFLAPTPVSVISAAELKVSGTQNLENLLADLSQFTGNQLNSPTANTVQAGQPSGTSTLNLRNLGPTRNLVLVNGRRYAIYGPEQVTDLNTIPSTLIARTEIVTGGSSAVYGSDAITGVVNFIMRNDFSGVEGRAQLNIDRPTGTPVRVEAGCAWSDLRRGLLSLCDVAGDVFVSDPREAHESVLGPRRCRIPERTNRLVCNVVLSGPVARVRLEFAAGDLPPAPRSTRVAPCRSRRANVR